MAEVLSRLDFYQHGRRYVLARAKRIDPNMVDVEGSDVNLFVGGTSFMAQAVSRQMVERVSALLLDGAEGEDLDRYAWDRYQLLRKGASPAVGEVEFSRLDATAGAGAVPIGTKLISLTGIEYITTSEALFGASSLTATAEVRAVQAGLSFQVGKNQIRRFDNVAALFDPSLEVNNTEATAGGVDVELDSVFKERIRDFWNSARRGTLAAIEFGAKTVAGVESAQATEAISGDGLPARVVNLYIADPSGVGSKALGASVRIALTEYRAAGIAVLTSTSIPEIVDVQLSLSFIAGVNTTLLTGNIRAAIVEFINSLGVNQPLYRQDLGSVLARFREDGLIQNQSSIVSPAGDLQPSLGRTLRTRLENVSVV